MTQQQASTGRGRSVLWVIIGVAAVVLAGLLVWGLVGGGDTEPTTTPTESVTTVQTTEGTDGTTGPTEQTTGPGEETTEPTGETSEPTDVDWGPVTPPNVDSLRDFFTAPNFPDSIGPFVQDPEGPIKDVASITVDYDDNEAIRGVGVVISMGRDSYTLATSEMPDATVMGNAVCGTTNDGIGDIIQCLVAGEPATLKVLTAGVDHMTLEELAEFTNSLYDQL